MTKSSVLQKAVKAIHPQLPLNERQSRQLLQVLKSSFQKQLDLKHPPAEVRSEPRANNAELLDAGRSSSRLFKSNDADKSFPQQASSAGFLEQILSNPLLSTKPSPSSFIFGDLHLCPPRITKHTTAKEVKQWFKNHLACGDVDFAILEHHLKAVCLAGKTLDGANRKRRLKEFEAGKDVLAWLYSSSLISSPQLWEDHRLYPLLVQCLTAEDCNQEIQNLLLMELRPLDNNDSNARFNIPRRRTIMNSWIDSRFAFETSIERSLEIFIGYLKTFQLQALRHGIEHTTALKGIFGYTGCRLSAAVTELGSPIPLSLYNSFFSTLPVWSSGPSATTALLSLYHPTHPDVAPAFKALDRLSPGLLTSMPDKARRRVLKLCLNSADRLLFQDDFDGASRMLEYARKHFAKELGAESNTLGQDHPETEANDLSDRLDQTNSISELRHRGYLAVS